MRERCANHLSASLPLAGSLLLLLPFGGQSAENDRWDGRFFLSGIQGEVRAVATNGNELYVAGLFTSADDIAITNFARWNGTNWSAVGTDINGEVNAIAIRGSDIFVGGMFSQAGGIQAGLIARWDGMNWFAVGAGVLGTRINALTIDAAGTLYAGGEFTNAGGVAVANIAKWDGTNWSSLGSGLRNDPYAAWVLALATRGPELFAGGFFTDAGGVSVSCVAKWDGIAWSALGSGVDDLDYLPQVTALTISGGDLYAGGAFARAGNVTVDHVARWDGATWSALGSGMGRYFGEIPVTTLAVSSTGLIAGGRFVSAGGTAADNLAVWDGATWNEFAGGAHGKIRTVATAGTNVFVGGTFTTASVPGTRGLAKWYGDWQHVSSKEGLGISGEEIATIEPFGTNIYVGGAFNACGSVLASNIAAWNGATWSTMGIGLNGSVSALCAGTGRLFVGGRFTAAGGIVASNIAAWDGTQWQALGSGVSGTVEALAWTGSELIVAGSFAAAGGVAANNVARWNGDSWFGLGSGVTGPVYALAIQGSNIFVGGRFTSAGGVTASNVARWNGSQWFSVGGGVGGVVSPFVRVRPPPVSALAVRGPELYVGGDFAWVGAIAATNIAKWDGTTWHALGAGVIGSSAFAPPPSVSAIAMGPDGHVYIGGSFLNGSIRNIGRWNGTTWHGLGDGIAGLGVGALHVSPAGELLVGGRFGFAGGKPAANFSIWAPPAFLKISRSTAGVEISWPAAGSYRLECTGDLQGGAWSNVMTAPIDRGTNLSVAEGLAGPQKFYRLRSD